MIFFQFTNWDILGIFQDNHSFKRVGEVHVGVETPLCEQPKNLIVKAMN